MTAESPAAPIHRLDHPANGETEIPREEQRQIIKNEIWRIKQLVERRGLNLQISCDDPEEPGDSIPDDHWPGIMYHQARRLVADAASHSVVVTISQKPLQPLAMGHYETVVETRPINPNLRQESIHADTDGA